MNKDLIKVLVYSATEEVEGKEFWDKRKYFKFLRSDYFIDFLYKNNLCLPLDYSNKKFYDKLISLFNSKEFKESLPKLKVNQWYYNEVDKDCVLVNTIENSIKVTQLYYDSFYPIRKRSWSFDNGGLELKLFYKQVDSIPDYIKEQTLKQEAKLTKDLNKLKEELNNILEVKQLLI